MKTVFAAALLALSGCSTPSDNTGILDRTLQAVGLERPTPPSPQIPQLDGVSGEVPTNMPARPSKITLRLHAGDVLNTGADGRSLSVVARIYKLKDHDAFEHAPYSDFQELKPAHSPEFARDVVDVREVVLSPGQQYDVIETVGADAPYFAVVALFRTPAEQRWRFVFDTRAAAKSGVTMGVHACALSVSAGEPLDMPLEMQRVAGVRCPSS